MSRESETLTRFIEVYCREKHAGEALCAERADLLGFARGRLERCPLDPKPKCKDCKVHCYAPAYRAKVREVMRFSGMHFVRRGRLDWLLKYFMS